MHHLTISVSRSTAVKDNVINLVNFHELPDIPLTFTLKNKIIKINSLINVYAPVTQIQSWSNIFCHKLLNIFNNKQALN